LLGAIADQGYELANIVEDLLVAARSEMGDLNVSQVSVNLKAQTAQVLESMRNEEASSITISGDPQFALADPQRVRQILRNLLTNAIRYGGSDIGVRIDEPEDGMVAVVVSDDGDGISDEARERIFERYEQEGDDTGCERLVRARIVDLAGPRPAHGW
jgi:signal transduction histidine kinase